MTACRADGRRMRRPLRNTATSPTAPAHSTRPADILMPERATDEVDDGTCGDLTLTFRCRT